MDRDALFAYESAKKSSGPAIAAELVGGLFQVFGIGNIIAGNVSGGIAMMLGYWALLLLNICLSSVLIGLVTGPITWLLFMVLCPLAASSAVATENARLRERLHQA